MKNKSIIANNLLEAVLISKLESLTGKNVVLENKDLWMMAAGNQKPIDYKTLYDEVICAPEHSDLSLGVANFDELKKDLIEYIENSNYGKGITVSVAKSVLNALKRYALNVTREEFQKLVKAIYSDPWKDKYDWKVIESGIALSENRPPESSTPGEGEISKIEPKEPTINFEEIVKDFILNLANGVDGFHSKKDIVDWVHDLVVDLLPPNKRDFLIIYYLLKEEQVFRNIVRKVYEKFEFNINHYLRDIGSGLDDKEEELDETSGPKTVGPEQPEERGLDQGGSQPLALAPELKDEMRKYHRKVVDAIKQVRAKTNRTFGEKELTQIMLHIAHLLKQGEKPNESTIYQIVYTVK